MSDPSVDGYVRTVAATAFTTAAFGDGSSSVGGPNNSVDVEKLDLISTIDGTIAPVAVKTMTTFTTPTIAVTETSDMVTVMSKRSRKAAKVDFVRFDSAETIFSPNDEESVTRAKIKDEIKK